MKKGVNISALLIIMFIISCTTNYNKIATIKNNTSNTITYLLRENGMMTDSSLYNDTSYMTHLIKPQRYDNYIIPDSNLTKAPDSAKTYIYLLRLDSLNKFRRLKLIDGILKHSIIKKIVVQLNKVNEKPLDTIYVR